MSELFWVHLSWLWIRLAWLAAWAGVYLRVIQVVTGVLAVLIAVVIFVLDRELLRKARWTKYFAATYAVFAVQYLVPPLAIWAWSASGWSLVGEQTLKVLLHWVGAACSTANNLLFLGCARTLLEKKRAIPMVAWLAGAITVATNLASEPWWLRLPDALLAVYALTLLGYAMYRNFSPRRGLSWAGAALNVVGGVAYGWVNLTYALNPFISSLSERFHAKLASNLEALAKIRGMPATPTVVTALDAMAFGGAFVLKFALFIGALLLIMRSLAELRSPRADRVALESVGFQRKPFVSAEVVARAIGQSVDADLAEVGFRLPGLQANEVEWESWLKDPSQMAITNPAVLKMTDPDRSIVGAVFARGRVESSEDLPKDPDASGHYWPYLPGMGAFVTLPVHYQGGIIGCVNVEWREPRPVDATTLMRLKQATANLAPVLDARRQLRALHTFSERAHRLEEELPSISAAGDVRELLRDLHDVLAPLATAVAIDLGFRRYSLAHSDIRDLSDLSDDLGYEALVQQLAGRFEGESGGYEVVAEPLKVGKATLGHLVALVASERDPSKRPSLWSDYLHRRAMASILSGALVDLARRNLGEVLTRAQASLAKVRPIDFGPWFLVSKFVARATDLEWAAATAVGGTGPVRYGFDRLAAELQDQLLALEELEESPPLIKAFAGSRGTSFVRLLLPSSKSLLWFGVGRPEFGAELTWSSPWNDFLSRLAESADAALVRFERQRLLLEISRRELLAAKVETSRLVLHEVRNRALEFSNGTLGVRTALERADVTVALDRAKDLEEQAAKFSQLANATYSPAGPGSKPFTNLRQAVDMVQALEDSRLLQKNITLTILVADVTVAVPIELVVLSLRELIENAARAIGRNGKITITAADRGSHVECHVIDSGPGVNREIQDQLFEFGITTKDEGGGLGLALARNALITVGGFLALTRAKPTTMTLKLPKAAKETVQ